MASWFSPGSITMWDTLSVIRCRTGSMSSVRNVPWLVRTWG